VRGNRGQGHPGRMAAAGAAMLLLAGAVALWAAADTGDATATTAVSPAALPPDLATPPAPAIVQPEARPLTREEKRFARIDRDDDGRITRAEYLAVRRRNFDRLDVNGDGRLGFEEYAVKGIEKFASLDSDGNATLDAAEFAAGAPKPRAPRQQSAEACRCPSGQMASVEE